MADMKKWTWLERGELVHAARTTVAAVASLLIARMLRMPDVYWAAIISMIVMQSALGAAWTISRQRLAGTAIGAAMGGLLATYLEPNIFVFGAGVFVMGVVCALVGITRNAYRYAGITLAIVLLITRAEAPWMIAVHRFIEISVGIAVGLLLTAVWPEEQPNPA
ncbi:MAG: FUSC family protein [Candidatus Acidiferrales bacterium]